MVPLSIAERLPVGEDEAAPPSTSIRPRTTGRRAVPVTSIRLQEAERSATLLRIRTPEAVSDADVEREGVEERLLGPGRLGGREYPREDLAVEVDVPLEKPAVERDGPRDPLLVLDRVERQLAREGRRETVGEPVPHVGEGAVSVVPPPPYQPPERRSGPPFRSASPRVSEAVPGVRSASRSGSRISVGQARGHEKRDPWPSRKTRPSSAPGGPGRAGVEGDLAGGRSPREERDEERRVGSPAGRDGDVRDEAGEGRARGARRGRGRPTRRRGTTSASPRR